MALLGQVVEKFQEISGHVVVEPAHMELAEPSILTGKRPPLRALIIFLDLELC